MLNKIALIRNIGQFDSIANISLNKLTLIYAENGRGKSTLSAIFNSLSKNDPSLILERRRLGTSNQPHIVIEASTGNFQFKDAVWSAGNSDVVVFDDYFVTKNIYSGVSVDSEHKQNLHELILGTEGVQLNTELQNFVSQIEVHIKNMRIKEAAIPASMRGSLSVEKFCELPKVEDVDSQIQELDRKLAAAQASSEILKRESFAAINLPKIDSERLKKLLDSDIKDLQLDAVKLVQQHINHLGEGGEQWLSEGIEKITNVDPPLDTCPFCTQDLKSSKIIDYYHAYFGENYAQLKKSISDELARLNKEHHSDTLAGFERYVRVAGEDLGFWKKFIETPEFSIDTATIVKKWNLAKSAVIKVLEKKSHAPLDKLSFSNEEEQLILSYNTAIDELNSALEKLLNLNDKIALLKESTINTNAGLLNANIEQLKLNKARWSEDAIKVCNEYLIEKKSKKETEDKRDAARAKLDLYRQSIFAKYQLSINKYLQRFLASFTLQEIGSTNNRGGSSCTYEIVINKHRIPIASDGEPSFKSALSAGDRNTLALAFFFASLEHDPNLSQKIVVIDDPMSSLDENRTRATIQEVFSLEEKVSQLVVLSHSKFFMFEIWKKAEKISKSPFKLIRSNDSSELESWSVDEERKTDHDRNCSLVHSYIVRADAQKEREVARSLRTILEEYIRIAYPIQFPPGKMLGNFCQACEDAEKAGREILDRGNLTNLKDMVEYANKFHHSTNTAFDTEIINDAQLKSYCERILKFIKK